jgi:hypothetical protein
MVDAWLEVIQEVVLVVGASSVGVIWAAALAGMVLVGWNTLTAPFTEWLKEKKE